MFLKSLGIEATSKLSEQLRAKVAVTRERSGGSNDKRDDIWCSKVAKSIVLGEIVHE